MRRALSCLPLLLLIFAIITMLWMHRGNVTGTGATSSAAHHLAASTERDPGVKPQVSPVPMAVKAPPSKTAEAPRHGPFTVISSSPEGCVVRFTLPDYAVTACTDQDGNACSRIDSEGAALLAVAGLPALPAYSFALATARHARVEITVEEQQTTVIPDCRPPAGQAPQLCHGGRQHPGAPMPAAHDGGILPGGGAMISPAFTMRRLEGRFVTFTPFQYHVDENCVVASTEAVLRIRFLDADPDAAAFALDDDAAIARLQRSFFLNAPDNATAADGGADGAVIVAGTLQLVVPAAWASSPAIDDFICWRRQLGWEVELLPVGDDAGTANAGTAIKSALQERYDANAFTHLLLLGDYAAIEPYQHSLRDEMGNIATDYVVSAPERMHAMVASDTPYAFLDGTGDILVPDAFFSRLPSATMTELEASLRRLMALERGEGHESGQWLENALYIADGASSASRPYAGQSDKQLMEQMREALHGLYSPDNTTALYEGGDPAPQPDVIVNALNRGVALMLYLGHGHCDMLSTGGFSSALAAGLANDGRLPWIAAPVCHAGNLEHGTPFDLTASHRAAPYRCLAAQLFSPTAETAGAAAVACSTSATFWDPPIAQLESFCENLKGRDWRCNGELFSRSVLAAVQFCVTYYDTYHSRTYDSAFAAFHAWESYLAGDCSAVPRLFPPQAGFFSAALAENGSLSITLHHDDGTPVTAAAICIQNRGKFICARTDDRGLAEFPLKIDELASGAMVRSIAPTLQFTKAPLIMSWLDTNRDHVVSNRELLDFLEQNGIGIGTAAGKMAIAAWQEHHPPVSHGPDTPPTEERGPIVYCATVKIDSTHTIGSLLEAKITIDCFDEAHAEVRLGESELSQLLGGGYSIERIVPVPHSTPAAPPASLSQFGENATAVAGATPDAGMAYDELESRLDALGAPLWPLLCPGYAGLSAQGRRLRVLRVAIGQDCPEDAAAGRRPQLLIAAGMHGNDHAGPRAVMHLARKLAAAAAGTDTSPEVARLRALAQKCVIWLIPSLNPDGYAGNTAANAGHFLIDTYYPGHSGGSERATFASGDQMELFAPMANGRQLQPEQRAIMRWLCSHDIDAALYLCGDGQNAPYWPNDDDPLLLRLAQSYAPGCASAANGLVDRLEEWQWRYLGTYPARMPVDGNDGATAIANWIECASEQDFRRPQSQTPRKFELAAPRRPYRPGDHIELAGKFGFPSSSASRVLRFELPPETAMQAQLPMRSYGAVAEILVAADAMTEEVCATLLTPRHDQVEMRVVATTDSTAAAIDGAGAAIQLIPCPMASFKCTNAAGWQLTRHGGSGDDSAMVWKDGRFAPATMPETGFICRQLTPHDTVQCWWQEPEWRRYPAGLTLFAPSAAYQWKNAIPLWHLDPDSRCYRRIHTGQELSPATGYWLHLPSPQWLML